MLTVAFAYTAAQDNQQKNKPSEVDFLFNYYQQDGEHSPVTGGNGTEELSNIAPLVIINIPLAEDNISVIAGIDNYSSASSDNIDPEKSGASGKETRTHVDFGYTFSNPQNEMSYGFSFGGSNEYDYNSASVGVNWSKGFYKGNSEIAFQAKVYFDNLSLIYPKELRGQGIGGGSAHRNTYDFSATFSQVLSKKSQIAFNFQTVLQQGFLSTPFHRVYFNNDPLARIEKLPKERLKIPVGVRYNYYLSDTFILKSYYRYYSDDFGMKAHTTNIDIPIRLNQAFTLIPGFRYHRQNDIDYFYDFRQAQEGVDYYSSDFDLSSFYSQKFGLAVRYYPLLGISEYNMPLLEWTTILKRIDLRGSYYVRSDGLDAFSFSLGLSFILP